jgi:GH15 family glucan-1,4-alpha-glucosidase
VASYIEDYALIGDCETAALVNREGSIDWLCWPHFASPACFNALLGTPDDGHWSIAPKGVSRSTRKYVDHTLVLETTFETEDGSATLVDFMPPRGHNPDVVRIVRGVHGTVTMEMELVLRFDYARSVPWVTSMDDGALRAIAGPDMAVLRTKVPLRGENLRTCSEFTIREGESIPFVLTYGASYQPLPHPIDPETSLRYTLDFWKRWAGHSHLHGEYAPELERSLITLKALTYRHTGGIVAAPTTSLPECIGGERNWDYRYCWLRDATFTLLALMNGGYFDEARAWHDWLLRAVAGSPDQVQIMYGIHGERNLMEWEIPWLSGHQNSKPVRIGNAASEQLQLDVYGELADSFLHANLGGITTTEQDVGLQTTLTEHLATVWEQPDRGIWEVRGDPQHFTHSKVMAWVAFDRVIKTMEKSVDPKVIAGWTEIRDKIHRDVCEKGFSQELGSFTQAYGSTQLDASLLLIPQVGFLPYEDPRVRGTIEAIEKHLMTDGLVLRYRTEHTDDGLPPGEGVFLACSFWMVSALKMIGRIDDAKQLFERLLALRNDVGLLAEEYDPQSRHLMGNFPQALSHIAMINAGFEFNRLSSPGEQRAQSSPAEQHADLKKASQPSA